MKPKKLIRCIFNSFIISLILVSVLNTASAKEPVRPDIDLNFDAYTTQKMHQNEEPCSP